MVRKIIILIFISFISCKGIDVVKLQKSNKVPKDIVFTDQLPKSAVGKVLRRELQAAQ